VTASRYPRAWPSPHVCSDATKYDTIEQRVTAKAVVTKDASRKLARRVETSNGLAICTNDAGAQVDLEATHALMKYSRDDGDVEMPRLHGRAPDDIMIKLSSWP
jgi:hypothetical protein